MDKDILLLIVGALIGFVGSTLSTFVSYVLENRRTKRQWQRDDFLRAESQKRDEIKLAQEFNMQTNLRKLPTILRDPHGEFCFLPKTRITLSTRATATIESLKVGDSVLSYDLERNQTVEGTITQIKESEVESYVIINEMIRVTSSHLFWIDNEWKRSDEINLQNTMYDVDGNHIPVTKLEIVNKRSRVYNLELINDSPFFAENILVNTFTGKRNYGKTRSAKPQDDVVEIDEFGRVYRAN